MNPLDKSWDFLKAPMEGGENKKPLEESAAARRKRLNDQAAQKIAEGNQTGLNDPRFQNPNKTPMERVTTTPSRASVGQPTEGTGFENLTEEQIQDLKYRRRGA